MSSQVQNLQAAVQHRDVLIQQLQTLVAKMSSREGTLMQCILGLDRHLADVERRSLGPQSSFQKEKMSLPLLRILVQVTLLLLIAWRESHTYPKVMRRLDKWWSTKKSDTDTKKGSSCGHKVPKLKEVEIEE
ncbi:hypothetical protein Tco_1357385 [Tanacetum coccineum]